MTNMTSTWTVGTIGGALAILVSGVLATSAVSPLRHVTSPAPAEVAAEPWTQHVNAADAALAAGDLKAAAVASEAAYRAAMASRRWEGLVEVADAHLRVAAAAGVPGAGVQRARALYMAALFRARDTGSVDGVLRVAVAFDRLGDRDVAGHAMRIAQRM